MTSDKSEVERYLVNQIVIFFLVINEIFRVLSNWLIMFSLAVLSLVIDLVTYATSFTPLPCWSLLGKPIINYNRGTWGDRMGTGQWPVVIPVSDIISHKDMKSEV